MIECGEELRAEFRRVAPPKRYRLPQRKVSDVEPGSVKEATSAVSNIGERLERDCDALKNLEETSHVKKSLRKRMLNDEPKLAFSILAVNKKVLGP